MTLSEATRSAFRKYFQFSGRATRSEYWKFILFILITLVVTVIANTVINGPEAFVGQTLVTQADGTETVVATKGTSYNGGRFDDIVIVGCFVPLLSVGWRRLHDTGISGWWLLAPIGIFVGVLLAMLLITAGPAAVISAYSGGPSVSVHLSFLTGIPVAIAALAPAVLLLRRLARPSQPGPNRYGLNPLEVTP